MHQLTRWKYFRFLSWTRKIAASCLTAPGRKYRIGQIAFEIKDLYSTLPFHGVRVDCWAQESWTYFFEKLRDAATYGEHTALSEGWMRLLCAALNPMAVNRPLAADLAFQLHWVRGRMVDARMLKAGQSWARKVGTEWRNKCRVADTAPKVRFFP